MIFLDMRPSKSSTLTAFLVVGALASVLLASACVTGQSTMSTEGALSASETNDIQNSHSTLQRIELDLFNYERNAARARAGKYADQIMVMELPIIGINVFGKTLITIIDRDKQDRWVKVRHQDGEIRWMEAELAANRMTAFAEESDEEAIETLLIKQRREKAVYGEVSQALLTQ